MDKITALFRNKKTPLLLLILTQAYLIFSWNMQSFSNLAYTNHYVSFIISALTCIALDLATVDIAFSIKSNKSQWIIAIAASSIMTIIAIAIAYNVTKDCLHAAIPFSIYVYSWYCALVVNKDKAAASEDHVLMQIANRITILETQSDILQQSFKSIPKLAYAETKDSISVPIAKTIINDTQCIKCNRVIATGSISRNRRNGYCRDCK